MMLLMLNTARMIIVMLMPMFMLLLLMMLMRVMTVISIIMLMAMLPLFTRHCFNCFEHVLCLQSLLRRETAASAQTAGKAGYTKFGPLGHGPDPRLQNIGSRSMSWVCGCC